MRVHGVMTPSQTAQSVQYCAATDSRRKRATNATPMTLVGLGVGRFLDFALYARESVRAGDPVALW